EAVRAVVELGRAARAQANLKIRQPLRAVIIATDDDTRRKQVAMHLDLIKRELSVKDVQLATSAENFAQTEVVPNFKVLGPKYGKNLNALSALLRAGKFERSNGQLKAGEWVLEPEEFEMRTRAREGFAVVDGDGFAVALDTEITPELALEGRARDVIRQIQDMRKESGFELTDRTTTTFGPDHADVFAAHGEWIKRES